MREKGKPPLNEVSLYFEEARIEFLKSVGLFVNNERRAYIPVVADMQCNYLQQMFFDDEIKLYVKANHVGNSSVDIHYMGVKEAGDIVLTGRGRLVYIHAKTGKLADLPEPMKRKLTKAKTAYRRQETVF
ncbi:thioesterase family protein [Lentibacillus sp. N15]|uniref:acyl-CoA thioesterase n=1 Tax=Lentibacillus songyuanensis TaxID=3136161 RepID=UPI0031BB7F91